LEVSGRIALSGDALKALDGRDIFRHPFFPRDVRLIFGDHVSADSGTGLVHTAPGHGYDDYIIGTQYGLPMLTPVDDGGVFTADGGEWAGQNVFAANDSIVAHLRSAGALVHAAKTTHSYPHCWRCRKPLIFRATEQWFMRIDHEQLREKVIAEIDRAKWTPPWSRDRIRNMTGTRADWCLSRQRAWGVPIPALRCNECGHVGLDLATLERVEEIFARESSDVWYSRPAADFVDPSYRCPGCQGASFEKEEDVLDVWFDSGCSQAAVLARRPELTWPADAYLEAVEQARGWFSSSLTCAIAERGAAPFRSVISHGLTVDEQSRKMSKSLGNSEDAADVANRHGADVIRLVYASIDYTSEMKLGATIFTAVSESYRKIRNTFRYLLGALAGFDFARDQVAHAEMPEFDRFLLARLERLKDHARRAYDEHDYQGAYQAILNFVVVELSSLYIDVARDRLYCSAPMARERRSAQTALYHALDTLVRLLAPLIPFTAEEVYAYVPGANQKSVHLLTFAPAHPHWRDAELEERWERLLMVRDEALKLLETMRKAGTIGAPLEASVSLAANGAGHGALGDVLAKYRHGLKELFIVSDVAMLSAAEAAELQRAAAGREDFMVNGAFARASANPPLLLVGRRAPGIKCQRCWCYADDGGDPELCPRCRAVVRA
ncbi:MAG: isoleucine--tRNA ligase, partial [Candidatus Binataceae bacterium]